MSVHLSKRTSHPFRKRKRLCILTTKFFVFFSTTAAWAAATSIECLRERNSSFAKQHLANLEAQVRPVAALFPISKGSRFLFLSLTKPLFSRFAQSLPHRNFLRCNNSFVQFSLQNRARVKQEPCCLHSHCLILERFVFHAQIQWRSRARFCHIYFWRLRHNALHSF